MQTLLALPFLTVRLHASPRPVLELQWLSYAPSTDLRAAVTQAMQLGAENRVKGWITDDQQQGAIRPRDLEWAEQTTLLQLNNIGLERFAQLESVNDLHRLTVATMYAHVQPQLRFELRRFTDLERARAWVGGDS